MKLLDVTVMLVCIVVFCVILGVAFFRWRQLHQPEKDIWERDSTWVADSRTDPRTGHTQVCIIRVDKDNLDVLERRILKVIQPRTSGYKEQFGQAMEEAYETAKEANVYLNRR